MAAVVAYPQRYEIRVRGRLSDAAISAFDGLEADVVPAETVLRGPVADQARLQGLLVQVQALGLELLELRRIP
jgi:hypothetical protein